MCKILEVAALITLQKRPQLRGQHLLTGKRGNSCLASEPGIIDPQKHGLRRIVSFNLARIDLHLQANWHAAAVLRVDAETELGSNRALVKLRARPSHGSSTARSRSRIGPMGPDEVRTRSMSSE